MELFWHATTEVMQIALAVRVVDFHLNYHQPQQWCIYATNTSDAHGIWFDICVYNYFRSANVVVR